APAAARQGATGTESRLQPRDRRRSRSRPPAEAPAPACSGALRRRRRARARASEPAGRQGRRLRRRPRRGPPSGSAWRPAGGRRRRPLRDEPQDHARRCDQPPAAGIEPHDHGRQEKHEDAVHRQEVEEPGLVEERGSQAERRQRVLEEEPRGGLRTVAAGVLRQDHARQGADERGDVPGIDRLCAAQRRGPEAGGPARPQFPRVDHARHESGQEHKALGRREKAERLVCESANLGRQVVDRHADEEQAPQRVIPRVAHGPGRFGLGLHDGSPTVSTMKRSNLRKIFGICTLALVWHGNAFCADYPAARRGPQVDDYFGEKVPDPYRWMEDIDSPETAEWVRAERAYTQAAFERIPERAAIRARLKELWNFPRFGLPQKRGRRLFYTTNDGLQTQPAVCVVDAPGRAPRVLLDPNLLSKDGTVAV